MTVKSTLRLHNAYRSVHRFVSVPLRTAKTRLSFLVRVVHQIRRVVFPRLTGKAVCSPAQMQQCLSSELFPLGVFGNPSGWLCRVLCAVPVLSCHQ